MTVENITPAAEAGETPEAGTQTPAATDPNAGPATDATRTFTQDEVNAIVQARVSKAQESSTKTTDEQVAAITARLDASENAAKSAIVRAAASNTHNPAVVASLVDLGDLTSADTDAINAKVAEFLTANPYLVKADGAAPVVPAVQGLPGAGAGGSTEQVSSGVMSEAEFAAVTPEQLAGDENLMKRYLATVDARA